jgi:hypothetical protein
MSRPSDHDRRRAGSALRGWARPTPSQPAAPDREGSTPPRWRVLSRDGAGERYLDGLAGRPSLPLELERELVAVAQEGDAEAPVSNWWTSAAIRPARAQRQSVPRKR